jgi:ribosomal protein S7
MEQKKAIKIKTYNLYNKFLGFLIKKGNKVSAKILLERALFSVSKKLNKSVNYIFLKLFLRLNTYVESKKVKIRNRSYIVPFSLSLKRRSYLAIKWLLKVVKSNKEKISFSNKLAFEILQVLINSKSKTLVFKKTNNNEAFLNRSNSHFRW